MYFGFEEWLCFVCEHARTRETKRKGQAWDVVFISNLSNQFSDPPKRIKCEVERTVLPKEGVKYTWPFVFHGQEKRVSFLPLKDTYVENIKGMVKNLTLYLKIKIFLIKHLPGMREIRVQSLGREDPLEKEMATHSNILDWKIPWKEEPGRLQSMGSQRVRHNWATSLSLSLNNWLLENKRL